MRYRAVHEQNSICRSGDEEWISGVRRRLHVQRVRRKWGRKHQRGQDHIGSCATFSICHAGEPRRCRRYES